VLALVEEYAIFVEKAIGNDPRLTAPWLSEVGKQEGESVNEKLDGKKAESSGG
jgi:hypothetical protein